MKSLVAAFSLFILFIAVTRLPTGLRRPPDDLSTPPAGISDFDSFWHDGRAELDGYLLTVTRYGAVRRGTAVMVYVTEPFSESKRVKVEDAARNPEDTIDVLKLNLVRDFQTGIYDYNTMASLFVRTADFLPVKETFTSAEWCGHVYEEAIHDPGAISWKYFSYFENESDQGRLDAPQDALPEDNLFILLRGLREEFLPAGGKRPVQILPAPFVRRLRHSAIAWSPATIERLSATEAVEVPAGRFATLVYVVRTGDGREGRFNVDTEYPHRIVRWSWRPADGEGSAEGLDAGELTGSTRVAYWRLNAEGAESHLRELGLAPPDRRNGDR